MAFVRTNDGVDIFYKDWGPKDAQPIVFHHGSPLSSDDWSKPRHAKVAADLRARLADLDAALGDKPWLEGDAFTVGDLMMVSVLSRLSKTSELTGFPRLAAYVARGQDRPAHRKAMADHMAVFGATAAV